MGIIDGGIAQNLTGCEVACELGKLDVAYGIVSTFRDWIFLQSCNDEIKIDRTSESLYNLKGEISLVGLREVTGKINALLHNLE